MRSHIKQYVLKADTVHTQTSLHVVVSLHLSHTQTYQRPCISDPLCFSLLDKRERPLQGIARHITRAYVTQRPNLNTHSHAQIAASTREFAAVHRRNACCHARDTAPSVVHEILVVSMLLWIEEGSGISRRTQTYVL